MCLGPDLAPGEWTPPMCTISNVFAKKGCIGTGDPGENGLILDVFESIGFGGGGGCGGVPTLEFGMEL